jgi:tagatose-6-phosphate ketose/aldose isomerase
MNMFGSTAGQLEQAGAQWTAREILQQPSLWQEIGAQTAAASPAIASWLQSRLQSGARVVLTGAGTSAYIGECLAPALKRVLPCRVDAVPTTDLVGDPVTHVVSDLPSLLVSFGRSGNSPESIAALDIVDAAAPTCGHLIFTCDATGALHARATAMQHARAHAVMLPARSNDRSFAMTSSFTGMLWAAAGTLGVVPEPAVRGGVAGDLAQTVLTTHLPLLQRLVAKNFQRVVYLGAKEFKGLARESALKMLELTDGAVVAIAETPLGFRHGPKTIVNADTLVVLFVSNDPHTRRYDLDLLAELRRDAVAQAVVAIVEGPATPLPAPDDGDLILRSTGSSQSCSDLELCLPYVVVAQSLALLRSLSLGVTPDNPNPAGTVHRVVRGVTIHTWK